MRSVFGSNGGVAGRKQAIKIKYKKPPVTCVTGASRSAVASAAIAVQAFVR